MREDMAHVVVERPRLKPYNIRKGRSVSLKDMPSQEGVRRGHALRGDRKQLNENLAPLRRYLEKQVGRPWSKVYSEIARHLRIGSTVQQHVRDHIRDFVAVQPRRIAISWPSSHAWRQPLYVDPVTGLLCRTDKLPEEKARRHARLNRSVPKPDQIADPARLYASFQKKIGPSIEPPQSAIFDPIASAMKRHPTLTIEEVVEMAENFGF